jgi:hypothetical protein
MDGGVPSPHPKEAGKKANFSAAKNLPFCIKEHFRHK